MGNSFSTFFVLGFVVTSIYGSASAGQVRGGNGLDAGVKFCPAPWADNTIFLDTHFGVDAKTGEITKYTGTVHPDEELNGPGQGEQVLFVAPPISVENKFVPPSEVAARSQRTVPLRRRERRNASASVPEPYPAQPAPVPQQAYSPAQFSPAPESYPPQPVPAPQQAYSQAQFSPAPQPGYSPAPSTPPRQRFSQAQFSPAPQQGYSPAQFSAAPGYSPAPSAPLQQQNYSPAPFSPAPQQGYYSPAPPMPQEHYSSQPVQQFEQQLPPGVPPAYQPEEEVMFAPPPAEARQPAEVHDMHHEEEAVPKWKFWARKSKSEPEAQIQQPKERKSNKPPWWKGVFKR